MASPGVYSLGVDRRFPLPPFSAIWDKKRGHGVSIGPLTLGLASDVSQRGMVSRQVQKFAELPNNTNFRLRKEFISGGVGMTVEERRERRNGGSVCGVGGGGEVEKWKGMSIN
ncbi:hypothetical protein RRG08_002961 [Elysia crispata]|uniref:Uncharacterized protein n=1 Tax=Elysia crispata TaxID=231223 RepID=A0AAE1E3L3_9GAST|nr:hypothetical protein RRG08_002961 [Elysia crispata]